MHGTFGGPAQQIPDKRDALAALRFGAERAIDHRNRAATAIGLRMKFPVGDAVAETDVHRGLDAKFILFMYKGCEQFAIAIASSFVPRVELPQCAPALRCLPSTTNMSKSDARLDSTNFWLWRVQIRGAL